ncbi:MAG: peptide chain release factor N(5)-glutamine methyltransferase [Gemmatimonadaceae bacterium]
MSAGLITRNQVFVSTSHRASSRTVRQLLADLENRLGASTALSAPDESAELQREAREIVAVLLDASLGDVSRRSDEVVSAEISTRAFDVAERRSTGEPLAYCLGSAAFRHLVLNVDRRVLIPRAETEVVVDEALKAVQGRRGGIAVDIGTGSGAIALSLATEGQFDRVIATDISPDALDVARTNAAGLTVRHSPIEFRLGADLAPLAGIKACLIVSNPPYIAPDEAASLPASVRDWEPALALFADEGGMARYDAILAGAPGHLEQGGWLVLELDSRRAHETARRATQDGRYTNVRLVRDLTGRDRVLVARTVVDTISQ